MPELFGGDAWICPVPRSFLVRASLGPGEDPRFGGQRGQQAVSPWGAPLETGAVLRLCWLPSTQLRLLTYGAGWSGGQGGLLWLPEGLPAVGAAGGGGWGPPRLCLGLIWSAEPLWSPGTSAMRAPGGKSLLPFPHMEGTSPCHIPPSYAISLFPCILWGPPSPPQHPTNSSGVRKGNGVLFVPPAGPAAEGICGWGMPGPRGTAGIVEGGGRKKQPKIT